MNSELAVIANDYLGSDTCISEMEQRLSKISQAGFSHVHWCYDWSGPYLYSYHEMCQISNWLDKYHLKAKGVHASEGVGRFPASSQNKKWGYTRYLDDRKNYLSDNEYSRKAGVEIINNRINLAEVIGAEEIVLHYVPPYRNLKESQENRDKFWCSTRKSFDELEQYCVDRKIKIALENLPEIPVPDLEGYFDILLGIYGAEFLGLCYDSGHAMIRHSVHNCSFLDKYADRIISVHLHDNLGYSGEEYDDDIRLSKADMHLIPFEGIINWDTVMGHLAKTIYQLPLVLEISMPSNISEDEFLKKAYNAATELTCKYKKARMDWNGAIEV